RAGHAVPLAAEALAYLGAARLASLVRERRVSPVELVRVYLERIERLDARLRAYITVLPEAALEAAHKAEAAVLRGEALAPLHGVPYAAKDQFDTASVRTTLGSRILRHHAPVEDATVISRMTGAGALLLGKLNMTEFALGGTREFPFGQPRNPWNPDHDPGGSSSGSGIAVAAGLCAVSLGEDTGGSVRTPASRASGSGSSASSLSAPTRMPRCGRRSSTRPVASKGWGRRWRRRRSRWCRSRGPSSWRSPMPTAPVSTSAGSAPARSTTTRARGGGS